MSEKKKMEKEMLEKKVWAVVGASTNAEKFGYKLLKRLIETGYETYAVNPICDKIEEVKCHKSLSVLPVVPDVIDVVVPPERAAGVLEEASKLGIEYIWFQPGTYDDEVLKKAEELKLKYVLSCVLVATRDMERVKR